MRIESDLTLYGSITAGKKVEFKDGHSQIFYRPAAPELTELFWPMD